MDNYQEFIKETLEDSKNELGRVIQYAYRNYYEITECNSLLKSKNYRNISDDFIMACYMQIECWEEGK